MKKNASLSPQTDYGLDPKIGFTWKSVLGLILIFAVWLILSPLFVSLANSLFPATISGFPGLVVLYLSFVTLPLGLFLVGKLFFGISPLKLLTEGRRPNIRRIVLYFCSTLLLCLLYLLLDWMLHPAVFSVDFRLIPWLRSLAAAPLILLAAASEELLFRGYLYRMFRPLKNGSVWAILLPGLLFCLIHGYNPEAAANPLPAFLYYLTMALLLGFIARRTNGLGAPIAAHFAINLFLASILTYPSSTLEGTGIGGIIVREKLEFGFVLIVLFVMVIGYTAYPFFLRKRGRK
ncbi:type II CAAX endopeptidase family protein [Saccharibacillus sp. CPCC 101409]|uniref:CPBP family intramembrane glutamic endopeptidase n=1 Tax=Saccharibacillus sp. CPCC 101409 TaxID=3058041 RepID=UPI002671B191|nr:type II CAAX endopeptidase family protein [Saccharibacillus sp. CPCC 101409]MDO3411146.1 type II CAAX endopeptidase family protein [Saccharibacillus sp. CPCC 101409]